ncbi:unnamed protein product [marine sediment metagenome]|uniref:Uncharacterized protein n=1 Tax=marine sediment metagenome TaxID=412755 RepID=X0UHD3_9ZZZZ
MISDELRRLRAALVMIASQKLENELSDDEWDGADIDAGYNGCVREAREALTPPD